MNKKEKPAKKAPAKKAPAKKVAPAKKAPAKKPVKKEVNYRTYHLVKRNDGMWEVKFAGGSKAIKLFKTQKEALAYSEKMAENQGASVAVHASKGKSKGRIQ